MTELSTDQFSDPSKLSPLGLLITELRDQIIEEWTQKLRDSLPEARDLTRPILVNTLPAFLDNIAEAVSNDHPRVTATMYTTLAAEHGGERARLTNYSHSSLIREYQFLRLVLFETLQREGAEIKPSENIIINASIDQAIQESAYTFSLIHSELREQYMATLSHDMKNPLSAITTCADIILRASEEPQVLKQAGKIKHNANRINKMIDDLLDVTAIRMTGQLNLKLDECEAKGLIEEVFDQLEGTQLNRLKFHGDHIAGIWDRNYLRRAFENLISNAFKYGDEKTDVSISIYSKFDRFIFSIHNFGNPIATEEKENIFKFFRRTPSAKESIKKGWGLGLPLVKAVAESHGGSLTVDSSAETGTTFSFDIPLDSRPYQGAPITN